MRISRRTVFWAALAILIASGCRAPGPPPIQPFVPPPSIAPLDLQAVSPTSLEPDYKSLPAIDPVAANVVDIVPVPVGYRGLSEEVCRKESAARAGIANLLLNEEQIPAENPNGCPHPLNTFAQELRFHLSTEARNRAATQALEQFFQLADAEGRGEIVRSSLPVLDQLRATVRKAKADGLRVPVDADELDRQRVGLLALLGQADLGAKLLDIDLKRRIGVNGHTTERLRPLGSFAVSSEAVDAETAVSIALETRADLRLLRTAYLRLTIENLPSVRELLRSMGGLKTIPTVALRNYLNRNPGPDPVIVAELAVRRQQLLELVAERERHVADEVRAAVATLTSQTQQVALTRWRAEQIIAKAKSTTEKGPLIELPADLESLRARADVIAAVMNWHQARVKLAGVQGLLADTSEKP